MAKKELTDAQKAALKKMFAKGGNLDKPKAKKPSTSYSPKPMGLYEQGQTSRAAAKKHAEKVAAKRLKATKYAPAPMTAKQKETIRRAAEKKQALRNLKKDPIVKGAKTVLKAAANPVGAGLKAAGAAVKRAKTVGRELRDIPTAVGTAVSGRNVGYGGGKFAAKDLKTQLKEVGSAIKSGKKGTEAAQVRFGSRKKGTVGAGSLDQNVSKKKAPRK